MKKKATQKEYDSFKRMAEATKQPATTNEAEIKDKHTPGPWRVVGHIKGHSLAMWIFGPDPSPGANRELQIMSLLDSHVDKAHLERRKADFVLMASAPTLKEENEKLKEAIEYYQNGVDHFFKCINWGESFLDAEAIQFMNDHLIKFNKITRIK